MRRPRYRIKGNNLWAVIDGVVSVLHRNRQHDRAAEFLERAVAIDHFQAVLRDLVPEYVRVEL